MLHRLKKTQTHKQSHTHKHMHNSYCQKRAIIYKVKGAAVDETYMPSV